MVNIGKTKAKGRRKTKAKARGKARGKVVAKSKDIKQMLVPSFMPTGGQSHMMPDGSRMAGISHPIAEPKGKPQSMEQSLFNNVLPTAVPLVSQLGYPALTYNFQPQSSSTQDRLAYQGLLTHQPTIDVAGSKPTSNIATDIFNGNADAPDVLTPVRKGRGVNKPKMEVIDEDGNTIQLKKTPVKKTPVKKINI